MKNAIILSAVASIKGCKFFNIRYTADCGFPKKSGLAGVQKMVDIKSAQINYSYENAVNRHLEKQGSNADFSAQSLPWGSWFDQNKVIIHKGNYYLRFYTQPTTRAKVAYFEADGTPCSPARLQAIKSYLQSKQAPISGTQAAAGLVENQVRPKNIAFANIVSMKIDGTKISFQNTLRKAE